MSYKPALPEAPPSSVIKQPEGPQRETAPGATSDQDKLGEKKPEDEFGYIVTNQRYGEFLL